MAIPADVDEILPPGRRFSKSPASQSRRALAHGGLFWREEPTRRPARWVVRGEGLPAPADGVEDSMTLLKWALIFFVVSVIAGILGFTGISAASADIARFLFYVFVVIFLVLLVLGLTIFRV
jgi:uncharacterized membrane protein YtjA (UPF0391 family)